MCLDILGNLISDVIFLLLLIAVGWIYLYFSRRSRLIKFFGIGGTRRIIVYLSNVRVRQFGAIGIDGKKSSYSGSTGAFGEIQVANRFRDLFNFLLPSLSDNPGILSKILISDIQVELLPSPVDREDIERLSSFITLGTPAYNSVSSFVEEQLNPQAHFILGVGSSSSSQVKDEDIHKLGPTLHSSSVEVAITKGPSSLPTGTSDAFSEYLSDTAMSNGVEFQYPEKQEKSSEIKVEGLDSIIDSTYCFVERLHDKENNRKVFYVAGLSELATMGAANYLQTEWQGLFKKFGDENDFLVMLRVEPSDFKKWTRVFER